MIYLYSTIYLQHRLYVFATDKPIIFFDIAVRNLNSVVKSHFYDRVFRHKIDFKIDISSQIESAFRSYE